MEQNMTVVWFVLGAILVAIIGIFSYLADKKRREALRAIAVRLGLSFNDDKNYELATRYAFLDKLAQGANRYAVNTFMGTYRNEQVLASDYHYETHSTDSKGHRSTTHHFISLFALQLPKSFPELIITGEGIFSKIAQAFGYDDIDFESKEFSDKFCIRSRDKKFAYDVCNARMMEYLLANSDLSIEIEGNTLAFVFGSKMALETVETNLSRLLDVRSRMPDYLFTNI